MLIPNRWCCPPILWEILKSSWKEKCSLYNSLRQSLFSRLYRQYSRTQNNSHRFTSLGPTEKYNHRKNGVWNSKPPFESLSSERKQFYAYSCGVWLVDGMSSYLINLSETFDRYNAFDITYNLLEQNLLSEKLKACPHSFLLKIRWKKLPLWIS